MSEPRAPLDLPWYLAGALRTLQKFIGLHASRNRAAVPLMDLTWIYLNRVARRFAALLRKVRAGKTAAPPRLRAAPAVARVRKPQLPRGFGWLIRLAPEVGQIRSQIRHFLEDAEFAALLAADPRFGRLLRPLCRMMAISPGMDPNLPPILFKPALFKPRAPRKPVLETRSDPAPEPLARPLPPLIEALA